MNNANNKRLYLYSALFIALVLNVPKLFALRKDGIVAHYWHFNLAELTLQTVLNFLFCLCIFYLSSGKFENLFSKNKSRQNFAYIVIALLITFGFTAVGITAQKMLFAPELLFGSGILLRFLFSLILIFIELRIAMLLQQTKAKEIENEHLRNAYLKSELEVLKGQLNPHFFFNSLSSLSAVVRENPQLAQHYIGHLSKSFRYTLQQTANGMSTIAEEIAAAKSYVELMKMRHESGLKVDFFIDETKCNKLLPHMSLQPLIENALKHNSMSEASPLYVIVSVGDNLLQVKNNLQPVSFPESSSEIGLANLNERYHILMQKEIEIIRTPDSFIVNLPLK